MVENVIQWLRAEGYPLEFHCADICQKAGLSARVHVHIPKEGDRPREADVLATYSSGDSDAKRMIMGSVLAECEYAKKPWVVLCQSEYVLPIDWTSRSTLSPHALMALFQLAFLEKRVADVTRLRDVLIPKTDVVGFSLVQGMPENDGEKDVPFAAIQKVQDAGLAAVESAASVIGQMERIRPGAFIPVLTFAIPCVVIKGPIVAAWYNPERSTLECSEIRSARIDLNLGKSVYLLNSDSFPEFVPRALASIQGFCTEASRVNIAALRQVRDLAGG